MTLDDLMESLVVSTMILDTLHDLMRELWES